MSKGNPNPKLENLKPFTPKGDETMTGKLFVRVPQYIEDAIKTLPAKQRSEFMRKAIVEAVERELLPEDHK